MRGHGGNVVKLQELLIILNFQKCDFKKKESQWVKLSGVGGWLEIPISTAGTELGQAQQ